MALTITRFDPNRFLVVGYLESRVYRGSQTTLGELKDAIRRTVGDIDADLLHSAVIGVVTLLTCLIPCSAGHVEHLLVKNKCTVSCYCDLFHYLFVFV
ncbi:hypothetical protein AVEN_141455-1 [Araneus ventricosus]|uniref:Uncharacterized protein n=1 Tax=Araneus ventricosus TaxID=182803 RepID=A0A4Y2Q5E5_ARAVE|nr:hypothetical protein AVEN_141455-1 [Araneus ventricosus]